MKKTSILSSVVMTLITISVMVTSNMAFSADVLSLITKGTTKNELGQDVTSVDVNCASATTGLRVIVNTGDERGWCSKDIPDVCSRDKVGAAKKVCHFAFTKKIEEYQNELEQLAQATSDVAAPSSDEQVAFDKLQLERDRIRIEQQKLQIRRQELELNKRRLELERQALIAD